MKIEFKKGKYYADGHVFQDYQWQIAILYCAMTNKFDYKYNCEETDLKDGSFIEWPTEGIEIIDEKAFVRECDSLRLV